MMPLPELFLALLVLLLTPGPTNTLLALSGAERGTLRALRLIPAEAAAYLLTTLPLAVAGTELLAAVPVLRSVITFAAAIWVAWLAVKLWRVPTGVPGETATQVTGWKVFTTTLLNPKALIIGLVLLPAQSGLPLRVALFTGLIVLVATAWAFTGATIIHGLSPARMPLLRRFCACWLAVLSIGLSAAGFTA